MKSKALATWAAVMGGVLGLHRLYLRGPRDPWVWVQMGVTLLGAAGAVRMRNLGVDDPAANLLIPLLGLSITAAMLTAIVYGLTPDERWAERHHPDQPVVPTGWGPVLGVVAALMLGATALMATVAFVGQRIFEGLAAGS